MTSNNISEIQLDLLQINESIDILHHKLELLEESPKDKTLKIEEALDELSKLMSIRDYIIEEIKTSQFI